MNNWFSGTSFSKVLRSSSIFAMALAGVFTASVQAQTTDEGSGPSEHPSAPMEMGQPQAQPPQSGQPGQVAPPSQPGNNPSAGQPMGQPPQMGQGPMADEAQPGGPSGEGPAKVDQGVGRISMIHGAVSTQRGDSGDWSAAILNQPVLMGDKVSTGDGGRAEVQLDYANILRLGPNSQANLSNFTRDMFRFRSPREWPIIPCSARARRSRRLIRPTLLCIRPIRMACTGLKSGPMATASSSCARVRPRLPHLRESPT